MQGCRDAGVQGCRGDEGEITNAQFPMPNSQYFGFAQFKCPMPNSQFPTPNPP
ncbi:hypothetical protein JYQ62_20520 [Nostoc sp. UHCC 0702]|nr:hypothetical protein JYQ62_20520 [Nostoc sp. UHCC 0702]